MKTIQASAVTAAVKNMCMRANIELPEDVSKGIIKASKQESVPEAQEVFRQIIDNMDAAKQSSLPLCQDTGLAVFFAEIGQEVYIDGNLTDAINEGVRQGYKEAFLRASACDPFTRTNTQDNTPAIIHYNLVSGDKLRIFFLAKGGGAENMSSIVMLTPSDGWIGIKKAVIKCVAEARSNPCPPIIVGIGIGSNFEYSALLAKKALLRKLNDTNPDPELARKEDELLALINTLNIGPMGLGGKTTALAVKILASPCHIASLPLAINIQCHSSRHMEIIL